MPQYRVYLEMKKSFTQAFDIYAADPDEAIEKAEILADKSRLESWHTEDSSYDIIEAEELEPDDDEEVDEA